MLARGHLHVRPMVSRAIAQLILLTDPTPPVLTDTIVQERDGRRLTTTIITPSGAPVEGVRIVDMPDLGVVDDTSSVVGERAGSGQFSALALRDYVLASVVTP